MSKIRTRYILLSIIVIVFIMIEPVAATESEIENTDWWAIVKEGLNFFADVLDDSAELVRNGADKLKEMME